jgi:WD40 repeat protein
MTLEGHTDFVWSLALLSNDRLASSSKDKTIKIWNTQNGLCLHTLTGHSGSVRGIAALDNDILASSSDDQTIKLWNVNTGLHIKTLLNNTGNVNKLVIFSNGTLLASNSFDSIDFSIKIWELASTSVVRNLYGHTNSVNIIE